MVWLNFEQPENIKPIDVTFEVFQLLSGWLKFEQLLNIFAIKMRLEVSHCEIFG